ncbi:MAG: transposase [Rhodospirillales bacterium]|nr:transposase [Rhodospirillales bacterium]
MSKKTSRRRRVRSHLKKINLFAAGIDVGSKSHFVAVPEELDDTPVREFGAFTGDLRRLAEWLVSLGIQTVVMESTGIYWIPLYEILEDCGIEVLLVDARHVRNVPGRKSDVMDCQWLLDLHTYGLLRGAFRPPESIVALRAYLRQRERLIAASADAIRHMQKALRQMNLLLDAVVSDISGVTGMGIIRKIVDGERDPRRLAACATGVVVEAVGDGVGGVGVGGERRHADGGAVGGALGNGIGGGVGVGDGADIVFI